MRSFINKRRKQYDLLQDLLHRDKRERRKRRRQTIAKFFSSRIYRKKVTHDFLSSTKWYGIGPIISFVTLAITIILSIYIFEIGRFQSTAHIRLQPDTSSYVGEGTVAVSIWNDGPATAQNVFIDIGAVHPGIFCGTYSQSRFRLNEVSPTNVINNEINCQYTYDSLYPNYVTGITIDTIDSGNYICPPTISISGQNVEANIEKWPFHRENRGLLDRILSFIGDECSPV